jgi:hypothetical protein
MASSARKLQGHHPMKTHALLAEHEKAGGKVVVDGGGRPGSGAVTAERVVDAR